MDTIKTSRLEELIDQYRTENGISECSETTSITDLSKNVKIKNEIGFRQFSDLSEEEKRKVLDLSQIDYRVSTNIQKFGSTTESPITKHAQLIISKYSAGY